MLTVVSRYSRSQLAELSGVPARTIRYYHSLGVLPKPGRAGKEAVYGDDHLARLRDIAEMQARGLRLDAIREVFDVQAQSGAPADWRAVLDPRYPGAGEQSAVLDDDQLTALLGDRRADILDELIAAEYLHRCEDGWRIPDQPMLKGALILYDLGTDITLSGALRKLIRTRLAELADEIVATFRDAAATSYGGEGIGIDHSRFRERFRAAAREVAGATLADEIDRAVRESEA
ncbi:MerR family transcriptional regulator [Nocardia farcinica]|uniref:Putative transcriptional regulator n=1 Tax=Nocardia farcinica (strain IFM 10152) TaxID=247156 RepID=Q5YWI0_NOCFA|nr:MerR family transcriptional regulator [Nocardia farcinica]BAD57461.1 putative transcriptional regulator [Nocardia farcinica IFM 10152]